MLRGWLPGACRARRRRAPAGAVLTCIALASLGLTGCVATGEGQAGVTIGVGGKGSPGAAEVHPFQPVETQRSGPSFEGQ
jgi:hypothetical protein